MRHLQKGLKSPFQFWYFGSDLSKMDEAWSNLMKLNFSPVKKCYCKSCHIYNNKDENVFFILFLDQICPKWIKLDQIGFRTNQKMLL